MDARTPHSPVPGAAGSRSTCGPDRDEGRRGLERPLLGMSPLPGPSGQRERGPRGARGEKGAAASPERPGDRTCAPPSSPRARSRVNFAACGGSGSVPGPGRARRGAGPTPVPAARRPAPLRAPGVTREEGGAPRAAEGAKGTRRARTWSPPAAHPATRPPRRRGARPRTPRAAGAGAPHLLRRVQALPLDGRGHWGGRWRARRRGRSLCGAGPAGGRGSDPLGCSGAAAAPAPPLAPAPRRRARPSALKDSHRAPFKRQRERANHRAAGAPRPGRGRGTGTGAQPGPRGRRAARRARDSTFHPGPAAARPARPARCRRRGCAHLRPGSRRGLAGGRGAAARGRGGDRASPRLPALSGRSIFAQLPSVSGFISFFLITIQIQ